MDIKIWAALSTLAVFACGNNEPELTMEPDDEEEIPSLEFAPSTDASNEYFHCFQSGRCARQALSSSPSCRKGRDYTVTVANSGSRVLLLSIHGGGIEPHTTDVTQEAAQRFGWSRYDFSAHGTPECLRGKTNRDRLHITATNFDDPVALDLVAHHTKVVSIHGDRNISRTGMMCVGGHNRAQIAAFISSINSNKSDFSLYALSPVNAPNIEAFPCNSVAGVDKANIANRVSGGRGGLQLEMSLPLLAHLASSDPKYRSLQNIFYTAVSVAMRH